MSYDPNRPQHPFDQHSFGQPQYGAQFSPGYDPSQQKDWLTTLLLCLFLGCFGAHRFYTGHTAIGIIQLLTAGGCFLWWLVDAFQIAAGTYKDSNGRPLLKS